MLGDGQAEEDAAPLGHVGDALARALAGRALAQIVAVDGDRARHRCTSPEIARSVVVLPAPLAPSSATTSPGADVEVEVAHDRRAVVAGGQPVDRAPHVPASLMRLAPRRRSAGGAARGRRR